MSGGPGSVQFLNITIIDDTSVENVETFLVQILSPDETVFLRGGRRALEAEISILDNDGKFESY